MSMRGDNDNNNEERGMTTREGNDDERGTERGDDDTNTRPRRHLSPGCFLSFLWPRGHMSPKLFLFFFFLSFLSAYAYKYMLVGWFNNCY